MSLITTDDSDPLFEQQRVALERLDALDRVTHYFDITRFWSADLAASAGRISEDLADPALKESVQSGEALVVDLSRCESVCAEVQTKGTREAVADGSEILKLNQDLQDCVELLRSS